MKTIIIICAVFLSLSVSNGFSTEAESQDYIENEYYKVIVYYDWEEPTDRCCTEECIEYLIPSKFKLAIYKDCSECERCLWNKIFNKFGR